MDCGSSWSSLISLFAPNEAEKINKFIFFIDKKRALLSICLQHAMIRHFLRQNHNSFGITHLLTHLLTHLFTHSLTHLLTYLLTHSLT